MSLLKASLDRMKFDKRLVESNIRSGVASEQDYKSHVASLPDLKDRTENVNLEDEADKADLATRGSIPQQHTPDTPGF